MADKKDSEKKLLQDDASLWQAMTKDVKRLPGRTYAAAGEEKTAPVRKKKKPPPAPEKISAPGKAPARGLDSRTAMKLRRGQMRIEAQLDLHGMSREKARAALGGFLAGGYARGLRCVLVITGKGSLEKAGVLRQCVPQWLAESPLAEIVLSFASAQQKDGGAGALYILLRRKR